MSERTDTTATRELSILQMSAPLVVSFWMRSLFTFVDTIFAATLGDASVAAIGLSLPFEFGMIAIWVGLSTGLTSNLARAIGAQQNAKVQQHLGVSWRLVWGIVPVFFLAGLWIWSFGSALAPDAVTGRQFAIYGSVLVGGSAFTMFWSVIPDSIVKAHHDTRATMWAGIWSNVINVALNTLFTFVFHWGVFGIALSTVIGRFGGLIYALGKARTHEARRLAETREGQPGVDPAPYRSTLQLAVPAALAFCLMGAETALVNMLLASRPGGTEAVAAYAIYFRIYQFVLMPAIAVAVAMLPFAARRFGAGDMPGITRGLRQAHGACALYLLALTPVLYFFALPIAQALTESSLAQHLAMTAIRAIPLMALVSLPVVLVRPAFEGLGQGRPGLILALLRHLFLLLPCAAAAIWAAERWHLPALLGLLGGLAVAAAMTSSIALIWARRRLRTA
ncbi:MAG: MATE family efflux transporter [Acidobacteriota bacterium]